MENKEFYNGKLLMTIDHINLRLLCVFCSLVPTAKAFQLLGIYGQREKRIFVAQMFSDLPLFGGLFNGFSIEFSIIYFWKRLFDGELFGKLYLFRSTKVADFIFTHRIVYTLLAHRANACSTRFAGDSNWLLRFIYLFFWINLFISIGRLIWHFSIKLSIYLL